jgi:hypothetical protein
MGTTRRQLHPATNPTGYMTTAGIVYAGTLMIYNVVNHHGAWSTPVFISLVAAIAALLTRQVVTPVADPYDGAGRPLTPAESIVPPGRAVSIVPPQPAGIPQVLTVDDPQGPFLPHPADDTQVLPAGEPPPA